MEKRFVLFLVLSALVLFGHLAIQSMLAPPRPGGPQQAAGPPAGTQGQQDQEAGAPKPADGAGQEAAPAKPKPAAPDAGPADATAVVAPHDQAPGRRVTLGSMAPDSPYRLLVTLNNRGGAIEYIELSERTQRGAFRYHELDVQGGYLGRLALEDEPDASGCRVHVVGPGTPAALATPNDAAGRRGLRAGDVIQQIDDRPIRTVADFDGFMAATKPGQNVELTVRRAPPTGQPETLTFHLTLTQQPLKLIQPEINDDAALGIPDPLSFLFTLEPTAKRADRLADDPRDRLGLTTSNWEVAELDDQGAGPAVEFRFRLAEDDLTPFGIPGPLEVVKRYRLPPDSYHLELEIELRNVGSEPAKIAYRLDGPNGLPLEGWWYSRKIHPTKFSAAGARDVVWSTSQSGHGLIGCSKIYSETKKAEEEGLRPIIPLFADTRPQPLTYVGVDTQYFAVVLKPDDIAGAHAPRFEQALAVPAGDIGEKTKSKIRTTNVTFRLTSPPETVPAGETFKQRFVIFAGPKKPTLLAEYGLEGCIAYGWFWWVAIPLSWVLHLFESLPLVNYGLAIILLTVLVRSAMIPLSRKATRNAQMMQKLAPEMKRLAEKYKNDMEKRGQAQRELFAKHHYNPFGGCLLMFVQLPIFIGLYRSLAVDIELRQAPLIPGLSWCANLAGPDMLFYWKDRLPGFLADETGWLGPYFNALPIITIVLFLLQQKMFMPPATDDQTRMQQKVMKFMMIFMGFLFFRVASGLCIYFIASSLWGLAERKLLPPPGQDAGKDAVKPGAKWPSTAESKRAKTKRKVRKR